MPVLDVANFILKLANEDEADVSNLKLQKLVYYAQGFHLALFDGEALFDETIEAWAHGPVVPDLYHEFKDFGRNPIIKEDLDINLTDEQEELISEVYDVFGQFSAWKLRNMTHDETPWVDNEAIADEITHGELLKYFKTRLN